MERNQGPFAPPNPNEPIDITKPPQWKEESRQRRQHYVMTPEENVLINECQKEAFYQRSLPLSFGAGLLTQYAIYKGMTKPNGLKVFAAYFGGYLLGKASYIPACRRKVLQRLPNSNLARRMQGLPLDPNLIPDTQQEDQPVQRQSASRDETYTNTNLDTSRPTYDLDSRIAPQAKEEEAVKRNMTYQELRQQNRARAAQPPPPTPNQDYDRRFPKRTMQDPIDVNSQQEESSQRRKPAFFADRPPPNRSGISSEGAY